MENGKFRLYEEASKIIKKVQDEEADLKTLTDEVGKDLKLARLHEVSSITLEKIDVIDKLIEQSHILEANQQFNLSHELIRVLIAELLFGSNYIVGGTNRHIHAVLSNRRRLSVLLKNMGLKRSNPIGKRKLEDIMPLWVRINTLKISVADALKRFQTEGWKLVPFEEKNGYRAFLKIVSKLAADEFMLDFHMKELLAFPNNARLQKLELFSEKCIQVHNKASCLSSWILNPPPGSTVLEMCAAPGSKTLHLAAIMKNKGTLYAADWSKQKCSSLCDKLEKSDVKCTKTLNIDALTLNPESCPGVEYILVDPPCSGPEVQHPNKSKPLPVRIIQQKLLLHALTKFPSVKRVIYTTTTQNKSENEGLVHRVLATVNKDPENPVFKIDDVLEGKWVTYGSYAYEFGSSCLYGLPDTDLIKNTFVAVFTKVGDHNISEGNCSISSQAEAVDSDGSNLQEENEIEMKLHNGNASRSLKRNVRKRKKERNSLELNNSASGIFETSLIDGSESQTPKKKKINRRSGKKHVQ